jgi:hypothetical protein
MLTSGYVVGIATKGVGVKTIRLLLLLLGAGATVIVGTSVAVAARIDPPQKATVPAEGPGAILAPMVPQARSTGH